MNGQEKEFLMIVDRWQGWLRIRRAINWTLPGLIGGLAAALGFSLAVLGELILNLQQFIILSVLAGLCGIGLASAVALLWPLSQAETTRFFDRHFDLFARSATALEFIRHPQAADTADLSKKITTLQLDDALVFSRQVKAGVSFFLKIPRMQAILVFLLLVALVTTGAFSKTAFLQAQARQAFQAAVENEIEQLETIKEEVLENDDLTPQEREEIVKALEKAIEDLKKADSPEQAVAAMQNAEGELQSLDTAKVQQQSQQLQQAGQELLNQSEGSSTPLQQFAQALAQGAPASAANALSNLDLDALSPEEIAALIEQLEQAADALNDSNPELADQLREAADQLSEGNTQAAQQALQQASNSLQSTAGQIAQASAARQAANRVSQGTGRLVQAGQSASSSGQQSQGQGQGQGQGEGQGSGEGQGTGQGSGQGSSQGEGSGTGGGAGQGTSDGSEGQMNPGGSGEISQNNGPGDGGERLYEQIYAPRHLGGSGGDEVTLPKGADPGDVIGTVGTNPGSTGPSMVPYEELPQNLIDTYRKAFQDSEIPSFLREVIKNYYSNP